MGIHEILRHFLKSQQPRLYEMVITQDGLSLEGNEVLGAVVEDILRYVEKKGEELKIEPSNVVILIKNDNKAIGIKRIGGLGVGVVTKTLDEALSALTDVEKKVNELLQDQYQKAFDEYLKEKNKE